MRLQGLLARRGVVGLAVLLSLSTARSAQNLFVQRFRADAGPDRYVTPLEPSVTLQGGVRALKISTLPSSLTIAWTQISGPAVAILDADTFTPTVIPSGPGNVVLRLRLIDAGAGADTDDMRLHVFGDDQDGVLGGEPRKWHKVTVGFTHLFTNSEIGTTNPFLDLRLTVDFYHPASGALVSVPGFFAADGNAAETSATSGNQWRVNFTPDRAGSWYYLASFRQGTQLALSTNPDAGTPVSFDGAAGSFQVEPADPYADGFLAAGRLDYVGAHHLRFAETHAYHLKNEAGSPENLLGYYEFDGTSDQGGALNDLDTSGYFDGLHHYDAHEFDYVDRGVPLWQGGKGRRIFGALDYLAARGVNSLFALSYNVDGGDGQEVWPWQSPGNKLRFDVSKLAQWERVLDHMTRCGIVWHVITQETENDHVLDGGALNVVRKLYYRELVARFAHAPGLVWNLGEENDNSTAEVKAFADYIRALDPYDHPIALHNRPADIDATFGPLLGSHLEQISLQGSLSVAPQVVKDMVDQSAAAGRPWSVNYDEQNPASSGVVPDSVDFWHDLMRQEGLWPTLLAQGGGCAWYFGYSYPHSDLDCEDFRSRDNMWLLTDRALDFLRGNVPFQAMEHADELASGGFPNVLAKRGEFYVVYLQAGGAVTLDLGGQAGPFRVSWFDAKNGGALQDGNVTTVSGPGVRSLGTPPGPGDWAALVRRATNFAPVIESVAVEPAPFVAGDDFAILVHTSDPNGPSVPLSVSAEVRDANGTLAYTLPLTRRGGTLFSYFLANAPGLAAGTWSVSVTVTDGGGLSASSSTPFEVR